uniref:protein-disulfide reductase n=1 Tax=Kalanchoe fedtschenkoi TaxID=63787 RepID=A0A7N0U7F2_KALFE
MATENCEDGGTGSNTRSTISATLASEGVQFLVSGKGKVPLDFSTKGMMTCLYFSANWCRPCRRFTPLLAEVYKALNKSAKRLEIIFVSIDQDEMGFKQQLESMPWLAVPFDGTVNKRLIDKYRVNRIPSFVPLNVGGEAIEGVDAIDMIEDYGAEAFPFTRTRKEELAAIDKNKREGGSLEDLLTSDGRNYLVSGNGNRILVASLVGKPLGIYFGAHWCPPCRAFTAKLTEVYDELNKGTDPSSQPFEVVFVSTDKNQQEFDLNLSGMPWLAIPFDDKARHDLCRIFSIQGIPALVLLGPDGKTVSRNGRQLISSYGAKGFPFTETRISEVEGELRKQMERFPAQHKDPKHDHVLKVDMAKAYVCNHCRKQGRFWAYTCYVCDYDLHPQCVEDIRPVQNV